MKTFKVVLINEPANEVCIRTVDASTLATALKRAAQLIKPGIDIVTIRELPP